MTGNSYRGPIHYATKAPLDESSYGLDEQETAFFKSQTGIRDDGALKQHIVNVQTDAYEAQDISLTRVRQAFEARKGAQGCHKGCVYLVGNDVRKAVADGFPVEGAIASDLRPEFWELGHKLFNSTPETFPVPFLPGDAFDAHFLKPVPPFYSFPEMPAPALSALTTLNPLLGHVSAIHASSFFHLFDEPQQLQLARSLAGLLSPEPGSLIFGSHGGGSEKGYRVETGEPSLRGASMFCHSPESWAELWDGEVFKKGTVKVEAGLVEMQRPEMQNVDPGTRFYLLSWSVTRL